MRGSAMGRWGAIAGAGVLALTVAGCGGQAGSVGAGDGDIGNKVGNLLAFNSLGAPPLPGKRDDLTIDCPIVQIDPGNSAVRVGGESSASVRYQIAIGSVARECSKSGDELFVRVGVEARTVLGPAGSPGNYTAPLRISIRSTTTEKDLVSKTYTVGGAVDSSGTAINPMVADPMSVPFTTQHAADDYEVVLSIGKGGGGGETPKKRGRRAR